MSMIAKLRGFIPAYFPDADLDLDVEVRVTYRGRGPSRPSWDDPGDGGDPPDFSVLDVHTAAGQRVAFLAGEVSADPWGELAGAVADALAEDERDNFAEPDDYRDYDHGPCRCAMCMS